MKPNELLLWLSARREGSWWQFRAAVEELCVAEDAEALSENSVDGDEFPVHQQLRLNLERLAHVEFFAGECEDGWRVAPPTLAVSRVDGGWLGVLCGARSVGLRQRFTKASEVLRPELINNEEVPDVFRVYAKDEHALAQLSDQAGIYFQSEASLAILSQLPATDPPSSRGRVAEFPSGADWKIHEFRTEPLGWNAVQRHEANAKRNALFKFTIYFQRPRYFIRWESRTYELPRAIGIYVLLRRRRKQVLRYNRTTCTLTLPAVCRPPLLLERALVLCCGFPPVFDPRDSRLTYAEVPEDIAQLTAQLLRQDLA